MLSIPFPQLGFSVHDEVSSWHEDEHLKVPPLNEFISVQLLIRPKLPPSQDSPKLITPLPQPPCTPWQPEVSILHELQFIFPPVNVEGL